MILKKENSTQSNQDRLQIVNPKLNEITPYFSKQKLRTNERGIGEHHQQQLMSYQHQLESPQELQVNNFEDIDDFGPQFPPNYSQHLYGESTLKSEQSDSEQNSSLYQSSPQIVIDFTQSPPHDNLSQQKTNKKIQQNKINNNQSNDFMKRTPNIHDQLQRLESDSTANKELNGQQQQNQYEIGSFAFNPHQNQEVQQKRKINNQFHININKCLELQQNQKDSSASSNDFFLQNSGNQQKQFSPKTPQNQNSQFLQSIKSQVQNNGRIMNQANDYIQNVSMSPSSLFQKSGSQQQNKMLLNAREKASFQQQQMTKQQQQFQNYRINIERQNLIQAEAKNFFKKKQLQDYDSDTNSFKTSSRESDSSSFESTQSLPSSLSTSNFNTQNLDEKLACLSNNFSKTQFNIKISDKSVDPLPSQHSGLDNQGFQYQTFSENPQNHNLLVIQPHIYLQSNSKNSEATNNSNYRNTSNLQGCQNLLDLSKATPAFKKSTKDQYQLNSNGTTHTLTSNEGRFSTASYGLQKVSQLHNYVEQLKSEFRMKEQHETSEGIDDDRRSIEGRQLIKKQPMAYKIQENIVLKNLNQQKKENKLVIKQDAKESNVYHIYGRGQASEKKKQQIYQNTETGFINMYKGNVGMRSKSKDAVIFNKFSKSAKVLNKFEKENQINQQSTKRLDEDFLVVEEGKTNIYLNTQSSKEATNPELIQSFIIAQNLKDSHNDPFYQSNPTMIRKPSSSSSSSSEESSAFETDTDNINSSECSSCIKVNTNKVQNQSQDTLNENQINEGVVYLKNGIGLPNPYHPQSNYQKIKGFTASMATTSASILSNPLGSHQFINQNQQQQQQPKNLLAQRKNRIIQNQIMSRQQNQSKNQSHTSSNSFLPQNQPSNILNLGGRQSRDQTYVTNSINFSDIRASEIAQSWQRNTLQSQAKNQDQNKNTISQSRNQSRQQQVNLFQTHDNQGRAFKNTIELPNQNTQQRSLTRLQNVQRYFWNDHETENNCDYGVYTQQTLQNQYKPTLTQVSSNKYSSGARLLSQEPKCFRETTQVNGVISTQVSNDPLHTNNGNQYSSIKSTNTYLNSMNKQNQSHIATTSVQQSLQRVINTSMCTSQPSIINGSSYGNTINNQRYLQTYACDNNLTEINQSSSGQEENSSSSVAQVKQRRKKSSISLSSRDKAINNNNKQGFSNNSLAKAYICCYSTKSKPKKGCQIF